MCVYSRFDCLQELRDQWPITNYRKGKYKVSEKTMFFTELMKQWMCKLDNYCCGKQKAINEAKETNEQKQTRKKTLNSVGWCFYWPGLAISWVLVESQLLLSVLHGRSSQDPTMTNRKWIKVTTRRVKVWNLFYLIEIIFDWIPPFHSYISHYVISTDNNRANFIRHQCRSRK